VKAAVLGVALLLAAVASAQACGVCAEDKIAATYEYRSVQEALARGKVVVYCELAGVRDLQRTRAAVARVRGVDGLNVRLSAEPAALSFVLDPRQQSPQAAVLAIQAALPPGAKLAILKVVAPGGGSVAPRAP
jgi:hypothetical protein